MPSPGVHKISYLTSFGAKGNDQEGEDKVDRNESKMGERCRKRANRKYNETEKKKKNKKIIVDTVF